MKYKTLDEILAEAKRKHTNVPTPDAEEMAVGFIEDAQKVFGGNFFQLAEDARIVMVNIWGLGLSRGMGMMAEAAIKMITETVKNAEMDIAKHRQN